ncbi:MAG: hypothetical protein R3F31_21420 [Verrucomicrobiales bacterium]
MTSRNITARISWPTASRGRSRPAREGGGPLIRGARQAPAGTRRAAHSDPPKGDAALWELKRKFSNESAIIEQFLNDPPDRLALIVVADKYLTGFDAPIRGRGSLPRQTLQEHNLLQAIAQ